MSEPPDHPNSDLGNGTTTNHAVVIVRAEEALIVTLVLALWVAAIALFFNRWGKIRMLEPYQPKFIQQHRPSCPLVDPTLVQHRSFSKFNINGDAFLSHQKIARPRQNSVFVGSSMVTLPLNTPRKVKSAFDLQNLIYSDPALNKSNVKVNLDKDAFRKQSLLAVSPRKTTAEAHHWDAPAGQQQPAKERRLSFKDLVDADKCQMRKEPGKSCRPGEMRTSFSNQSSVTDSRQNSVTNQELKSFLGPGPCKERRNSTLAVQKDGSGRDGDAAEWRQEQKSAIATFRRNSALLTNSMENERNYLCPRDSIKSGVIDFRRNSMLIINNLTEDIGYRLPNRDYSLCTSNIVLGSEFAVAGRRNSAMFSAGGLVDCKQRASIGQVFAGKGKTGKSVGHVGEVTVKLPGRKPSKSLDCGDALSLPGWKNLKDQEKPQVFPPLVTKILTASSASLNGNSSTDVAKVKKSPEESRSATNINALCKGFTSDIPCSSSNVSDRTLGENFKKASEFKAVPTVNMTTSLMNLDISSNSTVTAVASSGATKTKAEPV